MIICKAMKEKSKQGEALREAVSATGSTVGKKPVEVLSGAAD